MQDWCCKSLILLFIKCSYLSYLFKAPLPQRQPKDSRRNRAAQVQVQGIYLTIKQISIANVAVLKLVNTISFYM